MTMEREAALALYDDLVEQNLQVTVVGRHMAKYNGPTWNVHVDGRLDPGELRALIEVAEKHDLDVGGDLIGGGLGFSKHRPAVLR